jgi:peptidoglycan/LPS O-acetylase OafA/YrhL
MSKAIHLPGLNGLRAIAAVSVLWGHTFQTDFGDWGVKGFDLPFVADGVTLFFVISGFLITFLLLNERAQSHMISIPKFYMRRVLRIWPIYYLYMFVALLITSTWCDSNIWFYGFFMANIPFILYQGIIPIVHYWSIGVEEQFYLFWPWLVKISRGNNRRLLALAVVVCMIWLTCKWGIYLWCGTTTVYRFFAVTRFDCMMLGAIGAVLYFEQNRAFIRVFQNRYLGLVCFLLMLVSQIWARFVPAPIRPQVIASLAFVCILSQFNRPIINLENKYCDFVGKISYGIYVIHPLLIFLLSALYRKANLQMPRSVNIILIYCLITIITIFVAWLSYRFFENPFLKLKNKFAVIHSRNSMTS